MASYSLNDLLYLMERLRDPIDGCPWDKEQDFSTIIPHTIEESYELADAIERADIHQIQEELGDVLFQVVFYSQLGQEKGDFSFGHVVSSLVEKLLRRHPHVFPTGQLQSRAEQSRADQSIVASDKQQVKRNWESIKAQERQSKQQSGVLDDIPVALPALTRAAKLQQRAARTGFDWPSIDGVLNKLNEEITELKVAIKQKRSDDIELELGDVLFCCVNVARHMQVDPETAVRRTNSKFEARFRYIEERALAQQLSLDQLSLEQMDRLWDEAKKNGL